jgi:hypothetical protein
MNREPFYIDLEGARSVLAGLGISLSARQIKRAAETDGTGRRKLPFFIDPIDGRLKIEKGALVDAYRRRQVGAENNVRPQDE